MTESKTIEGEASGTVPSDETLAQPGKACYVPRILPWVEVHEIKPHILDGAVAGLRNWRAVTDTVIVSTSPKTYGIYAALRRELPELTIISGLTTYRRLGQNGLGSVDKWKVVADDVNDLCEATGVKRCILENEWATENYYFGKVDMDFAAFEAGLERLPKDVEILWYPAMAGETEEMQARVARLCTVVNRACNARFVEYSSLASPMCREHRWGRKALGWLMLHARVCPIPMMYFYPEPRNPWLNWLYEQAPEAMKQVVTAEVIIYPGSKAWVEAAAAIVKALTAARGTIASKVGTEVEPPSLADAVDGGIE